MAAKLTTLGTNSSFLKNVIEKVTGKDDNEDKFKKIKSPNVTKFQNPEFERHSKKFMSSEPELLFVAEYIVDDKKIGSLLVWERFLDATHYEIFKKNLFQDKPAFERVLFLDAQSLEEETVNYIPYLKDTVGLDLEEDKVFVILDTIVKQDRIYKYKIKAARIPKSSNEVDYDAILEGKGLTKPVAVDQSNSSNIFDFAGVTLGSRDLAWVIALLNDPVGYFGRNSLEKPLVDSELDVNADGEEFVLIASDVNDVVRVINDSITLFGVKPTFEHLLKSLKGLNLDFRKAFVDSIDEVKNVFSYDNYRDTIKKQVPVFSLVLQAAESGNTAAVLELSKLSVVVPSNTGSESFSSIEGLTKILTFVNDIFLAVLYAQDKTQKIKNIIDDVQSGDLVANAVTDATAISLTSLTSVSIASDDSASTKISTQGSSAAVAAPTPAPPKTSSSGIFSVASTPPPTTSTASSAKKKESTIPQNSSSSKVKVYFGN